MRAPRKWQGEYDHDFRVGCMNATMLRLAGDTWGAVAEELEPMDDRERDSRRYWGLRHPKESKMRHWVTGTPAPLYVGAVLISLRESARLGEEVTA